jgi:hypothetical protein
MGPKRLRGGTDPLATQLEGETQTQTQSAQIEDDEVNELVAAQNRLEKLRRFKAFRDEEAVLERELTPTPSSSFRGHISRSRHKRRRISDSSSSEREIKVKNITRLTSSSSFRQRDDWLADLQRAFQGASRRYRKDSRKILLALDYVDNELRAQWNRYAREEVEDQDGDPTWETFTAWSLRALGIDQLAEVYKALDRAHQRQEQSPATFNNYLESLEDHLPGPRDREDVRAYKLYAKLSPAIRDQLDKSAATLPKTRHDMVAMATRVWEAQKDRGSWKPPKSTKDLRGGGGDTGSTVKREDSVTPTAGKPGDTPAPTQSAKDKSNNCFKCGKPGYKARECRG